jgi:hypothetical protein
MRRVPEVDKGKPLRSIRTEIPTKEWKVLAVKAVMEDRDMQDVVADILVEYAKNYKP